MDVIQSSLPYDVTLKIASSLPVRDVCALGSCSKFWRELCGSDCIWISLYKWRWPSLCYSSPVSDNTIKSQSSDPLFKDWRKLYIGRHNEMAGGAASVVNSVEQCSSSISLEVGDFLKAIKELCSLQLGFKDVELFLFKPELSALLNLIGLYYCIDWLEVPSDRIMEALESCKISERQVFVKWWKLGRRFYGFRKRDELQSRSVSLGDLATAKDDGLLRVLRRGAVHEVLRVQISVAQAWSIPWVSSRPSIS